MRTYSSQQSTYIYIYTLHIQMTTRINFISLLWTLTFVIRNIHQNSYIYMLFPLRPVVNLNFYYCLNEEPLLYTYVTHRVVDLANEWASNKRNEKRSRARLFYQELIIHVIRESAQMYLGIGVLRNVNLCRLTSAYDF